MIITLCGSIRFLHLFDAWNEALSCAGHLVFSLGMRARPDARPSPEDKVILDSVHKNKIAASDAILVLNRFAYIGESTMSEIEHAQRCGKEIRFLESWGRGCGIGGMHTDEVQALARAYGVPDRYPSPIATCNFNCFPHDWLGDGGARRSALVSRLEVARMLSPMRPLRTVEQRMRDAGMPTSGEIAMPSMGLTPGARVRTTGKLTPRAVDWRLFSTPYFGLRRSRAMGTIVEQHTMFGPGRGPWRVRHDDGTEAPYDRDELTVTPVETAKEKPKCALCGGTGRYLTEIDPGWPDYIDCPNCKPASTDTLTTAEAAEIIASAPGQIAPGQQPIGFCPPVDVPPILSGEMAVAPGHEGDLES